MTSTERLRYWRHHRGLARADLAARAGMSLAELREIERRPTTLAERRVIASAMNVQMRQIWPEEKKQCDVSTS